MKREKKKKKSKQKKRKRKRGKADESNQKKDEKFKNSKFWQSGWCRCLHTDKSDKFLGKILRSSSNLGEFNNLVRTELVEG